MRNIDKATELAKFSIRQLNKPRDLSRRKDDWKLDIVIENLERIQELLEKPNEEFQEQGAINDIKDTPRVVSMDRRS